jgi:organic radical activating enzyme
MAFDIPDDDPEDSRVRIANVEFYITNVCNLTCSNCNRFNNYNFSGWQRWSDYEPMYTEWAQHVRLQRVAILGGEPLLNPTICDWIDGINGLWSKPVNLLTNGTRLNHVNGLYDAINVNPDKKHPHAKNWIGVSLHNVNDRERCFDEIRKFLRGNINYYHKSHPQNINNALTFGGDHAFVDSNGVKVCVWEYSKFYSAGIQRNLSGNYILYNSDPVQAHNICGFAMYKCYHFIRGALYKCGPVALFPEFDQQHTFDISESDRELLNSYRPLQASEFPTRGKEFLAHIDDVIPQCKFCPDKHTVIYNLNAVSKKSNSISGFD